MQLQIFSIRDSKGAFYDKPFYQHNEQEAIRSFRNVSLDQRSQIHTNPEDYDLYHLGTYDNITGKIQSLDTPQHIVKANSFTALQSEV